MKVSTGTTPAQIARELNSRSGFSAHIRLGKPDRYPWLEGDLKRFPGYRACVRRVGGIDVAYRPRVYINRGRYRLDPGEWPIYDKHLADAFGLDDPSKPFPGNPDGIDVKAKPYFTHFIEFYLDRPPVLRVLEADMDKGPMIESFNMRDSILREGIFINALPAPYEWDIYPVFCVASQYPQDVRSLPGLWSSDANPPQYAYPPAADPGGELIDPDSDDAVGVPEHRLGWFEPESPCACPNCAERALMC